MDSIKKIMFTTSKRIYIYLIVSIFFTLFNVKFCELLGQSMSISKGDNEKFIEYMYTFVITFIMVLLTLFLLTTYKNKALNKMYYRIRVEMYNSIQNRNFSQFKEKKIEEYVGILVNDTKNIEQYIKTIFEIIEDSLALVVASISILYINFQSGIFVIIMSCIPTIVPMVLSSKLKVKMNDYSNKNSLFLKCVTEQIEGYETLINYDAKKTNEGKFTNINSDLGNSKKKAYLFMDNLTSIINTTSIIVMMGILLFGMYMALQGKISVGVVFSMIYLSNSVNGPINNIAMALPNAIGMSAMVKKYEEINRNLKYEKNYKNSFCMKKNVACNDISIQIDGKYILNNVSLNIEKGKKYAIVGQSGSGKSTLIKAILGYFEECQEYIMFDGVKLSDIDKNSLYEEVAYISQSTIMFKGTLKENITMFNDRYDDKLIWDVLKLVKLDNKVNMLEKGLDTLLDEKGNNFSNGEKQRISMARAILKWKRIFIVDEITSSLDYNNYCNIEKILLSVKDGTIIAVTHRLDEQILKKYDTIIVVNGGKIEEIGSFNELMNSKAIFYKLFQAQEIKN